MDKIKMTTPLVEMDGDEMTRILWQMIKEELLLPFIDLKTEYYDLGLEHRNETNDQVTVDSAEATKKYGVAVKCATITPNAARMTEYHLKEMWKSPNGTIRSILDGTVFRAPILVKGIVPYVKNWTKPITIARHAYGDVYKNVEIKVPGKGKAELVYTAEDGTEVRETIHNFEGPGVIQGIHNTDKSISSFARACFNYAIDTKQDLWFATKDTISKKYDHDFKDIFQEIYDTEYKSKFEELGIEYFYTLIDDAVARLIVDGIISGVGAVLGFVPQMLVLFLFLAFLESCGYMARVAFIMDRIFRKFGLSGKSFIPMLIGSGCGVPGIMASRTIENDRDRKMTIMTTTFVPCGAKLPIIALIAGAFFDNAGWVSWSAYFVGVAAIICSGIILKKTKMFAGDPAPFVMELPAYHWPTVGNVLRSVWERGWSFIKKAGTIILLSTIVLWFLMSFGWTDGGFGMLEAEQLNDSILAKIGSAIAWIFIPLGWTQAGEGWKMVQKFGEAWHRL